MKNENAFIDHYFQQAGLVKNCSPKMLVSYMKQQDKCQTLK